MSAFDRIVNRKPRENAGPPASNRFAYQQNWGLKKLLSLQESGEPYTIIFDYYDDILVLNSDEDPTCIDFYQVKTEDSKGHWTMGDLLRTTLKKGTKKKNEVKQEFEFKGDSHEEEMKNSWVGKLMLHSLDFKEDARDYYFVTNINMGKGLIPTNHDGGEEIAFADLDPDIKKQFKEKLKKEIPELDVETVEKLHFIKGQMALNDYVKTVIGYIHEFLEEHYPTVYIKPRPVYEHLIAEIRKRNDKELKPSTVEDLVKYKAFTRKGFTNFLKGIETLKSMETKKVFIQNILLKFAPDDAAMQRSILRKFDKIKEETLIYDNHEFLRLLNAINVAIGKTEQKGQNMWEWCTQAYDALKVDYENYMGYEEDYLKCLILYQLYE